jgi:hypothetical protein
MKKHRTNKSVVIVAAMLITVVLYMVFGTKSLALENHTVNPSINTTADEVVIEIDEAAQIAKTEAAIESTKVDTSADFEETVIVAKPANNVANSTKKTDQKLNSNVETETENKNETVVEPEITRHTHSYSKTATEATCVTAGYATYVCECGDTYVDDRVNALGHDYKSVVTAPAIGSNGYTTHICKTCGDEYIDSYTDALIPEVESTPMEPVHKHEYVAVWTIKSNCTTEGYTIYECDCGDSYNSDYVAKTEHNYKHTVIAPTTEIGGYTLHVCFGCGDSYKDSYTDKVVPEIIPDETDPVAPTDPDVNGPVESAPAEDENNNDHQDDNHDVYHCDCSDGHLHEEVVVGCYTYVYCEYVTSPFKSEDGFTVYYPYDFYF